MPKKVHKSPLYPREAYSAAKAIQRAIEAIVAGRQHRPRSFDRTKKAAALRWQIIGAAAALAELGYRLNVTVYDDGRNVEIVCDMVRLPPMPANDNAPSSSGFPDEIVAEATRLRLPRFAGRQ